jgi:UPF0716 protein FxsA
MLPLLFLIFIVVPIAELYVIIQVGEAIGAIPTILLLIVDSIAGSWLLRSQGRAAWRRFMLALDERRPPAREVFDGALIILGGALLISPGFITDVFGALLLLPPSRAVVRGLLARHFTGRLVTGVAAAGGGRARRRRRRDHDVEGSAVDHDPPNLRP